MKDRVPTPYALRWITILAAGAALLLLLVSRTGVPAFAMEAVSGHAIQASAVAVEEEEEEVDISNEECIGCHNPDILEWAPEDLHDNVMIEGDEPAPPRKKPPFVMGELNPAIKQEAYEESVHGYMTCMECHADIEEIPHKQRLESVDCAMCHEDSVDSIKASAHGEQANPQVGCIGCHDVHYSQGAGADAEKWERQYCLDCHQAYGIDNRKAHAGLYAADKHLALGCMTCHQGEESGVHYIASVETNVAQCESCHSKYTILSDTSVKGVGFWDYNLMARFINQDVFKEFGYVIGAHRIPLLDLIIVLLVIGPLGLPIVHGGLRFLTRRKEPVQLPEEKILLHPLVERIWHWVQALCIVMLIITGVVLHWPEWFNGGFAWAVDWHNFFGWVTVIVWLIWLVYNLGTGRITHYVPKKGEIPTGMMHQARFYAYGIFKHEHHPYSPSEDNKFNPLQKIAYLQFQALLFPILLVSGLLYMYPATFEGVINAIGGMTVLAVIHFILAGLFAAFLVAHLYLATTGETIGENFKAIITGYGIKTEPHGGHDDTSHTA